MAETPPEQLQSPSISDPVSSQQYWCYQCDKRVSVESRSDLTDIICFECKNGFVESISAVPPSLLSDHAADAGPSFGNELLQVLRLIARAARESDAPPAATDQDDDSDYLRIELDGWNNDNGNEEGEEQEDEGGGEDDYDDANEVEAGNDEEDGLGERDWENRTGAEDGGERERETDISRSQREFLRRGLGLASRAMRPHDRIFDWAEILMGIEDNSIEFRLQFPDMDNYIGNPGDYADAAGYEALLQNLAESDGGTRRGAPPAAKSAVLALETTMVKWQDGVIVCAVCRDSVNVGEVAKRLPCGHGYHGDCIMPWLESRNTCPVCRFELPTDDGEYEEEKRKRSGAAGGGGGSSSISGEGYLA